MDKPLHKTRSILLIPALAAMSCMSAPNPVDSARGSLTEDQCNYFQVGGEVTVCHATVSPKNPVVKIKLAIMACVEGHSQHGGDYVAIADNCGPDACLAQGAPCDATLRCCGGACGADGLCPPADLCEDVTCPAPDQCHNAGVCDSTTGLCSNPAKDDGAACDDGDVCTLTDQCQSGACVGSDPGCVCTPGATASCYTGPAGTEGVGTCHAGTQTCNSTGSGYGACVGAATPVEEACGDSLDNDCDGVADDGCVCAPGSAAACYDGPAGTAGVGTCTAGTQTCNDTGTGYGACAGQVTPAPELCDLLDRDCDGVDCG